MNIFSIILIAIALSMDSLAVSIVNGLTVENLNTKKMITISFSLALFQGLMPLLGWFAGSNLGNSIKNFDYWIAFILLSVIGIKMIYEGLQKSENSQKNNFSYRTLIIQSFATSIDALAIGITFALLNISIITSVFIIGFITFVFSLFGLQIGKYFGKNLGKGAEILGGFILFGIGSKILIEHLFF